MQFGDVFIFYMIFHTYIENNLINVQTYLLIEIIIYEAL